MAQVHSQAATLADGLRDLWTALAAENSPHTDRAYALFCQASRMDATVLQGMQLIRLGRVNEHADEYYRDVLAHIFEHNDAPTGLQPDGADETTAA